MERRRTHEFTLLALLLALPLAGCDCGGTVSVHHDGGGTDDGGPTIPGIDGLVSIAITPADLTLHIAPTGVTTQAYTAMGTFRDHHVEDITSRVGFFIPGPDTVAGLGSFAGAQYRSGTHGGHTTVYARAGDVTGMTTLTLVMTATILVPPTGGGTPLPAMPGSLFGGPPDTSSPPALVYPNDGVVLPPNLGRIEIHWLMGASTNTLFEVAFTNASTDVRAYTRCERPSGVRSDGCIWEASTDAWSAVANTNAGGEPLTITVRGTSDTGGPVGTSMTRQIRFSYDDLNGTIYYWTTSGGTSVNRYDFGAPAGTAPMPVLYPSQTPDGSCVGCHAISHDGTKIAASTNGIDNGGFMLVDLVSSTILVNRPASDHVMQFMSFAPDGNTLVAVYGDSGAAARRYQLMLFDTTCTPATMSTCGMQTSFIDLGTAEASHPSWSPDGAHIAYTEVGTHNHTQRPLWGAVRVLDAVGTGWSAPRDLAPRAAGLNRYNPDFAPLPLSTFVLFDESTCPGGDTNSGDCDADADPSSKVWAVPVGGGTPVLLAQAMAPGTMDMGETDLQATFPRFAPFVFTLSNGDLGPTSLMWFTFASRRAYGLRSPSDVGSSASWLWMAAVLPDKVTMGVDPSAPAFALPFQALDTSNHIAVWTTQSVGTGILH